MRASVVAISPVPYGGPTGRFSERAVISNCGVVWRSSIEDTVLGRPSAEPTRGKKAKVMVGACIFASGLMVMQQYWMILNEFETSGQSMLTSSNCVIMAVKVCRNC